MRLPRIINHLTENDLYKYSMGQAIFHQFIGRTTKWAFKCRNVGIHFTKEMVQEIKEQIKAYCDLRYTKPELDYLKTIFWLHQDYIDYLERWYPKYTDFTISDNAPCGLSIETSGSWLDTSQYEMPVLMIVNEVYFRMAYNYKMLWESFEERLLAKYEMLRTGKWHVGNFSGFGLRRRLSGEAEEKFVDVFSHLNDTKHCSSTFIGLSNVYLGWQYEKMLTGTMAHEWIMCAGQGDLRHNPAYCNWYALKAWTDEYGTANGTALTDTIGTEIFLMDFQKTFATLYSGVRHDSGDPIVWGEKMVEQYRKLGIDPMTKMLLFSDSLDFEKADRIFRHFRDKAKTGFGIGTYLTNDTFAGPLNIVMKVTECDGHPVAKLSDDPGKGMCRSQEWINYLTSCMEQRRSGWTA